MIPNNPAAEKTLRDLYRQQWELSRHDDDTQIYLNQKEVIMKHIRKRLKDMGISEYDYHDWAVELYEKWDKELSYEGKI